MPTPIAPSITAFTPTMWGWYVKIESVQLSEDGRTAVLTTEPLYQAATTSP